MICLLRSACTVAIFDVVTEQLNIPGRQMKPAGRAGGCVSFSAQINTHMSQRYWATDGASLTLSLCLSFSHCLCPNRRAVSALLRQMHR